MRAPRKRHFLSKFSKVPKTPFLACSFYIKLPFFETGLFSALGELGKQFDRSKKRSTILSKFFLSKPPPPLEKILDPPLCLTSDNGCFVCFGAQVSSTFLPCSQKKSTNFCWILQFSSASSFNSKDELRNLQGGAR